MAIADTLKSVTEGLKDQWQEAVSVFEENYKPSAKSALRDNFKYYGATFGIYNFADYRAFAKQFYEEALDSDDPKYTIVHMSKHTIGIDYNGEMRGIFNSRDGEPIAFFKPNFAALGYSNKYQEIQDWKAGKLTGA